MTEIIKTYRQSVPALRFVGIKYGDADRVNGGFGAKWGEWFEKKRFDELEKSRGGAPGFEDSGAYIGLMRWMEGEPFEYWIGIFFPEGAAVPAGYIFVDFPASDLGVAWIKGKENDVYMKEELCGQSCEKAGMRIIPDENGAYWFFERYTCPRFTSPDENGEIILDICHFVEKAQG